MKKRQAVSPEFAESFRITEGWNPLITWKSRKKRNLGKEGMLMSDFEMLYIVLMMDSIIVTIIIAYIENTKK